jgi:DNA-binding MarR family transcriptional regulator
MFGHVPSRTKPVVGQPTPSVVYVIGRVNQGVRRELGKLLEDVQLTVAEYTTLSVLRARPGLSNAQLARRAFMAPQSMNEMVALLERRGLMRRKVDPGHARILRTELTPRGRRTLDTVEPAVAHMQQQMLAGLDPADRDALMRGLLGCMDYFSQGPGAPTSPAGHAA